MVSLYIDQDALALRILLRELGADVVTSYELGLGSSDDELHFLQAVRTNRTVLTHNIKDFQMLHRAWLRWGMQPDHAGVLIVPQRVDPGLLAQEIMAVFSANTPFANRCLLWSRDRGWWEYTISA